MPGGRIVRSRITSRRSPSACLEPRSFAFSSSGCRRGPALGAVGQHGCPIYSFFWLCLIAAALCIWLAGYHRSEFSKPLSRILFYHRRIKPVWDWIAFQSYALLWLDHLPILHPGNCALDDIALRIDHFRWRVFLRCLFVFSLFTLPVQLFPDLDNGTGEVGHLCSQYQFPWGAIQDFPGRLDSLNITRSSGQTNDELRVWAPAALPDESIYKAYLKLTSRPDKSDNQDTRLCRPRA